MGRTYSAGDEPVPGFRLVNLLGRGGFGEVWKATAPGGTEVALKVISLEQKQGFKEFRAIKTVKHIRHPHLVPIVALWLKDTAGGLFEEGSGGDSVVLKAKASELIIAMGLGDKNLLDRLRECQDEGHAGIPAPELLDYMEETAKAIDFLNRPTHDVGTSSRIAIQHCDIKPQNIMIVGGATQLCDFGLARVLGDARVTQTSMSAPYTPPEMITETKPSQSSDQYALAITYVELRTGTLPFENPTPAGMMWAHVQGKLDLSRLPPDEQVVIRRATAVDSGQRYATTIEMVRELRKAYEGITTSKTNTPTRSGKVSDSMQPGDEIVPGYKLVRLLGRGGYGTVWEALAPGGKSVALKVIRNLEGNPGRQEFRALELIKSLEHNHLLELHAYWLLDKAGEIIPDELRHQPDAPKASTLVIATKLASKNLLQRLHECQQTGNVGIPAPELLHYLRQAALAIDYLNISQHQLGGRLVSIQHRDIKPENILLARDGTVKVGDFGLARVLEGSSSFIHGDSTGYTPHYAAPELFNNQVSLWTDQYALALTYYKLRTGTLPFDPNASLYHLMMTHVEGRLELTLLSETERVVIAKATAVTPEDRYPACMDMVTALERGLSASFPLEELHDPPVRTPFPPPVTPVPFATPSLPVTVSYALSQPLKVTDGLATMGTIEEKEGDLLIGEKPHETPAPVLVRDTDQTMTPATAGAAAWKAKGAVQDRPRVVTAPSGVGDATYKPEPGWKDKTTSAGQKTSTNTSLIAAIAILLLVLTGGGYFIWWKNPKLPSPPSKSDDSVAEKDSRTEPLPPPKPEPDPKKDSSNKPPPPIPEPKKDSGTEIKPPVVTPPKVTREELATYERLLAENPDAALEKYTEALKKLEAPGLGPVALLGLARAHARKEHWEQVQQILTNLPLPDPRDQAHRESLLILAQAGLTSEKTFELDRFLDLLLQFNNQHQVDQLDSWETQRLQELTQKTVNLALAAALNPKLRESFKPDQPFQPLYRVGDVPQVYPWLTKAYALWARSGKSVPLEVRKEIALLIGSFQLPEPDPRVVKLVGDLPPVVKLLEDFPLDRQPASIPYLLVKAKAQPATRNGWKTAFDCYEVVWQLLSAKDEGLLQDRYRLVLVPALDKGDKVIDEGVEKEFEKRVGRLYLVKGQLLKQDRAVNPKPLLGSSWEIRGAFERAVALFPNPETHAALGLELYHVANALTEGNPEPRIGNPEQGRLLRRALGEANEALKGPPAKTEEAFLAQGLILEELSWLLGDHDSYDEAIEAFNKAIQMGGQKPTYLLGRGRCYYKRAVGRQEWGNLKDAATDLKTAIDKKLSDKEEVEAQFWLGMVYSKQPSQEEKQIQTALMRSVKLAEAEKSFKGPYAFGLESLAQWAEFNLKKASEKQGDNSLDIAIEHFVRQGKYAEEAKNEKHQFWAWNRLRYIGVIYFESKHQPFEAYKVYQKGMPAKISEATEARVRLLNGRNALLASPLEEYQQALKNVQPPAEELIRDAEHCLKLVNREPRHHWIEDADVYDAYVAAAFCYHHGKKNEKATEYLRKALTIPQPEEKNKYVKKFLEDWSK
jgi:serine/threonine protein kinase/tetratricopeptide (TPR) repeat protein